MVAKEPQDRRLHGEPGGYTTGRRTGAVASTFCVLNVQHHCATVNVTEDFVDRIAADHYLFCGYDPSTNPERLVVEAFADVRLGRSGRPQRGPNRDFTVRFARSADTLGLSGDISGHMHTIRNAVRVPENASGGRISSVFLDSGTFVLR